MGIREDAAESRMKKKVEEGMLSHTRAPGLPLLSQHLFAAFGEESHIANLVLNFINADMLSRCGVSLKLSFARCGLFAVPYTLNPGF